jgi:transmembrane sensor
MSAATQSDDANSAAAAWDARLRSHRASEADRAQFRAWCAANSQHQEAFDRLQQALATLRQADQHPQVRALREMARVAEGRIARRRRFRGAAFAAGVLLITVGPTVTWLRQAEFPRPVRTAAISAPAGKATPPDGSFETAGNERRTVALPDGSSVTLNASTRIETQWLPRERRIQLRSGQALFRVAKDPTRPFVVTVGDRTVTALGTAFDVKLDAGKVQVTLMEGRVAIRGMGKAAGQPTLELAPHEQLTATDGELPRVRQVDLASTTGWAEGQVYFTDEALSVAVSEMNKYSAEQILLDDPSLGELRINGMFRAGNQDGFASALTDYYPLQTRRDAQGRIVLMRRPARAQAE